jgi:hypothetical protein
MEYAIFISLHWVGMWKCVIWRLWKIQRNIIPLEIKYKMPNFVLVYSGFLAKRFMNLVFPHIFLSVHTFTSQIMRVINFLHQTLLTCSVVINMCMLVSTHGWIGLFCSSYHIWPWSNKSHVQEKQRALSTQLDHIVSTLVTRWGL